MPLDLNKARKCLTDFDFSKLFIEELGWSQPSEKRVISMTCKDQVFTRRQLAQLAGVVVFEVSAKAGQIPDARTRAAIHKEIASLHHENLLIFVDEHRTQSVWYWVKRQDKKTFARDHIFVRGQPGDLFLSKLNSMVFDIGDFDESGNVPLVEVADRLKEALDIERVTKKFFTEFDSERIEFTGLIKGIDDDRDQHWYASVLLNRLMFIYFLQRKFFLDKRDDRYLQNKLDETKKKGRDQYYEKFLKILFFEGFAKPEDKRSESAKKLLGEIKYLNGGLFIQHAIEERWPKISVPDKAFENLFSLFERYSWNLNDTPGGQDNEINPDVLGYIFEKYINQKAFGAYYTRPEITEYLCERTIHRLVLDGINTPGIPGVVPPRRFDNVGDLLLNLDAPLCKKLLHDVLPDLRLLDPACGSAAFLVSAMKTLINIYSAVIGKIEFLNDRALQDWLKRTQKEHKSISYFIKRSIITNNLFGVDIMEEAIEIAKLRLFLALVAAANSVDDLEPLPNIDFNILAGNSLIGLLHVDPAKFDILKAVPGEQGRIKYRYKVAEGALPGMEYETAVAKTDKEKEREYLAQRGAQKFAEVLREKNRLIDNYRHAGAYAEDLRVLRDNIEKQKQTANETLNSILLSEFTHLGIKYEQATWDDKKKSEGKPDKRSVKIADIEALKPFHWGFEFDEVMNKRGGFDAIITNPPWEIFKPNAKEFFEEYSDLVTKKKMTIKDFEKEQAKLLKDPDTREAWLKYQSEYPHISAFYRSAAQYRNQISVVDGKKAGTDINLYKLFLEQCHNLLRTGGRCGIIIPSGIYTDLGSKQLREMLISSSEIDTLFGLSNEKFIFEAVHHAFKFCILSFAKGGQTEAFQASFRINPREAIEAEELDDFLHSPHQHLTVAINFVRRLSPDSLSVMEFKNVQDINIAEKLLKFPLLGENIPNKWNVEFTAEFHMTNDSHLFKAEPGKGRLALFEGKMIWQFDHRFAEPRYWVIEKEARAAILGRKEDDKDVLDYQLCRLGFRAVSGSVNERTLVVTILPPSVFCGNSLLVAKNNCLRGGVCLAVVGLLNSFVMDAFLRQRVSQNINMFYIYQLPVPRLTEKSAAFWPIVKRAARLICTTPEFDDLAKEVGLKNHKDGATEPVERGKLRAELDGLIAHLYGLTEDEFAHILTTFPLVPDPVKDAARNAYRDVERGLIK